jgi:hypothetical protein
MNPSKPPAPDSDFVELRNYSDPIKANLAKELLEKEGVACYLKNELTSVMNWFYITAIGGISLVVARKDLERAEEILAVFEAEAPENNQED